MLVVAVEGDGKWWGREDGRSGSGGSGADRGRNGRNGRNGGGRNRAGAMLVVSDNGKGITSKHPLHRFEHFYRVDASWDRNDGGVGLGLTISKSIVVSDGGTIWCRWTSGPHSMFEVRRESLRPRVQG